MTLDIIRHNLYFLMSMDRRFYHLFNYPIVIIHLRQYYTWYNLDYISHNPFFHVHRKRTLYFVDIFKYTIIHYYLITKLFIMARC